jgi:hypothetical protein
MPELRALRSIASPDAAWRVHGVIFWDSVLAGRLLESRAGSNLRHTVRRRKLQQEVRGKPSRGTLHNTGALWNL